MWVILDWASEQCLALARLRRRSGFVRLVLLASFFFCSSGTLLNLSSCSTENQAEPYEEETTEEKAKKALEAKQFDAAIEHYEALLISDPERYDFVTLLASAYAGRAGIDLVSLLKNSLSKSEGSDVLGQVAAFVPSSPTESQMLDTDTAIVRLRAIPEALRDPSAKEDYAVSANLQLVLYATAAAAMTLNQLAAKLSTGDFDPDKLSAMSEAQVDAILNNLLTAAQAGASGSAQAAGQGAQAVLTQVANQPGETNKEKLINYLQSQNQ